MLQSSCTSIPLRPGHGSMGLERCPPADIPVPTELPQQAAAPGRHPTDAAAAEGAGDTFCRGPPSDEEPPEHPARLPGQSCP